MCCGLLDKATGMEDIENLSLELKNEISYVCSAKIYDDLFKFVRCQIRKDVSIKKIQDQLDKIWHSMDNLKI